MLSRVLGVLLVLWVVIVWALLKTQPKPAPEAYRPPPLARPSLAESPAPSTSGRPQTSEPHLTMNVASDAPSAPTDFSRPRFSAGLSKGRHVQTSVITASANTGGNKMVWPIESTVITSPFGERLDPVKGASFYIHRGVDVRGDCGTPVYAALDGVVIFADLTKGSGNCVRVQHAGGLITRYAHLSRADVRVGQQVQAGQKLGVSGATGHTTGPHLHFEIWKDNIPINPLAFHYRHLPASMYAREEVGGACSNPALDEYAEPSQSWGSSGDADIQKLLSQYQP